MTSEKTLVLSSRYVDLCLVSKLFPLVKGYRKKATDKLFKKQNIIPSIKKVNV